MGNLRRPGPHPEGQGVTGPEVGSPGATRPMVERHPDSIKARYRGLTRSKPPNGKRFSKPPLKPGVNRPRKPGVNPGPKPGFIIPGRKLGVNPGPKPGWNLPWKPGVNPGRNPGMNPPW